MEKRIKKVKRNSGGKTLSNALAFVRSKDVSRFIEEYTDSLVADIQREVSLAKILREKE